MDKMKNKYKICIIILVVEFVVFWFLEQLQIRFSSLFANAIGTLIFFLPLSVLFVLMSQDSKFSVKSRAFFKFIYLFIGFCYIGGLVASFLVQ